MERLAAADARLEERMEGAARRADLRHRTALEARRRRPVSAGAAVARGGGAAAVRAAHSPAAAPRSAQSHELWLPRFSAQQGEPRLARALGRDKRRAPQRPDAAPDAEAAHEAERMAAAAVAAAQRRPLRWAQRKGPTTRRGAEAARP